MKVCSVVPPDCNEITINGITFFLKDTESFVAIDFDGLVYAYRYMPKYMPGIGIWMTYGEEIARLIGSVEFEQGDSFDKCYLV